MAEPKPGTKTSELWVTAIAGILVILNENIGAKLDTGTITAIAGLVAAYTVGRTAVKVTANRGG